MEIFIVDQDCSNLKIFLINTVEATALF